ncbi:MAG: efflux RND transporter periplasmic adaptor subunit [Candidatus Delongbacteria bacterium]|nr:efflux RND transporter periplasmic adaptor subunit [Candidatus Delongbacteria bacterium]
MQTLRRITVLPFAWLALAGCSGGHGPAAPSGTLEATEIRLAPALAGRVLQVRVAEGETMAAGDTLLVLDGDLLRLQRAQTASGLAGLDARLKRAGDAVRQAELSLELAQRTLARLEELEAQGSTTAQQLDDARNARDRARLSHTAAGHDREALRAERESLLAALATQDRQLQDLVLRAPGPGTLIERYAEPGEWIAPGLPAGLLADLSTLELRFFLDETEMGLVAPGQAVSISVDAFPDETLQGRVSWISSRAEFTPKNVQTRQARSQLVYAVKATLDNPDGRLQIGMPAQVLLDARP